MRRLIRVLAVGTLALSSLARGQNAQVLEVGDYVVKKRTAPLYEGGRVVDEGKIVRYYTVDMIDKNRVHLVGQHVQGWLSADEVVLLDRAVDEFNDQIRQHPDSPLAHVRRTTAHYLHDELDKAIADFNDALRIDPRDVTALTMRGVTWACKNEFDKAIADYTEALKLDPKHAYALGSRGDAWQSKSEYGKAIADYTDSIRLAPGNPQLFRNRGAAWICAKQPVKALADFDQAIKLNPKAADAFAYRAELRRGRGEHDQALDDANRAIALDANVATTFYTRAAIWYAKKNYDQAIADGSQCLTHNPELAVAASAYAIRGRSWMAKDAFEKALTDYDQASRLMPSGDFSHGVDVKATRLQVNEARAALLLERGLRRLENDDADRAIADFSESIRLAPKSADGYFARGSAWVKKKDFTKALGDFKEALALDPNDADAYNGRARVWATASDAKVRDGKKAVESATRACELTNWRDSANLGTLAAAYAERGDFAKAIEHQDKANQLATGNEAKRDGENRLKLYRRNRPYREN